jgi:hypothetical protein
MNSKQRVHKILRKANKSRRKPWTAPATLTMEAVDGIDDGPRVWLSRAIDLMAFGYSRIPSSPLKRTDQRLLASRELCRAARTELLTLYGSSNDRAANCEEIPSLYFEIPRCVGDHDNTLGPDLDFIAKTRHQSAQMDYIAARDIRQQIWFNVLVDMKSFRSWLNLENIVQSSNSMLPEKTSIPKMQVAVLKIADEKWPDGLPALSVKHRNKEICESLRSAVSDKTIQRAFASRRTPKSGQKGTDRDCP